jgi:hypothetical protein
MAYFPDLSRCTYYDDLRVALPDLVAVGWLDGQHAFQTGTIPEAVYGRLKQLARMQWDPMMGMGGHCCEVCQFDGFYCNKELFIPGNGKTYAFPSAITHYIAAHHYLPPEEFLDAVMACPRQDAKEFFAALHAIGWPEDIAKPNNFSWHGTPLDHLQDALVTLLFAKLTALEAMDDLQESPGEDGTTAMTDRVEWSYTKTKDGKSLKGVWQINSLRFTFQTPGNVTVTETPSSSVSPQPET